MPNTKSPAEFVSSEKYKTLLPKAGRKQAMSALRSSEMLAKASRVIAMKTAELQAAVLDQVTQMETAARTQDWPEVFAAAHEIRGLAGTAGLSATGRIANGLCHYLDAVERAGTPPDATILALHLDAIVRSARTANDTARHGDAVAQQLSALVARKLAEIKH